MEQLIYYPGFEIQNEEWLKFALLYFNQLNPIIPPSRESYLSPEFHRLKDETNLFGIHRPDHDEGYKAALESIDKVEMILRHPERFFSILQSFPGEWKQPGLQKSTIFREKYADIWESFCLENRLAQESSEGLAMHRDL
jgi:hypothetical protein